MIEAALGLRRDVMIYGSDYRTNDGSAVRDFVHVSDLASAHANAVQYLLAGGETTACNLGTGNGYSVREIISAVESIAGVRVPVVVGARRPGDPPALVADAGNARKILDWVPRYPDLQTMVGTAWEWHSRNARLALLNA